MATETDVIHVLSNKVSVLFCSVNYLEGLARRKILSLPTTDMTSAQEICNAIVTAFGEQRSATQLWD